MNEIRTIPGFPDYEVSADGQVFSNRPWVRGSRTPRTLRQATDRKGYRSVALRNTEGRSRTQKVHWLVAAAFLGPRPAGMQIRHLNSDKTDNSAANLAYGTQLENMADRVALKTHCVNGHEFSEHGYPRASGSGRACRECLRAADKRRQSRRAKR